MEMRVHQVPNEGVVRLEGKDNQIEFRVDMITTEFWKFMWEQSGAVKDNPAVHRVAMTMNVEAKPEYQPSRFKYLSVTILMPRDAFLALSGEFLKEQ